MQSVTEQYHYEQPSAIVIKHFTDPDFLLRKYAALGREEVEILECSKDAQTVRLRIRYSDKPEMELPEFARKLLQERTTVVQEVVWNLPRSAVRITLDAGSLPVQLQCEMQLHDERGGSVSAVTWQVRCPVPLIGGKIERLLVEGLRRKSARDAQVSRDLLAVVVPQDLQKVADELQLQVRVAPEAV